MEEVTAREATFGPKEPTTVSISETVQLEVTKDLPIEPLEPVISELPALEP